MSYHRSTSPNFSLGYRYTTFLVNTDAKHPPDRDGQLVPPEDDKILEDEVIVDEKCKLDSLLYELSEVILPNFN